MLVFFFFVAFAAAGYCPFKPELQNNVVFAPPPPLCNVSLLGDGLCACFGNNHCAGGCGCLVPSGSCSAESCAFPRVCFCEKIGGQNQNGADCSPVNSGPCRLCPAPHGVATKKATPTRVLVEEFGRLADHELDNRLHKLRIVPGKTRKNKVDQLISYTIEMESA